MDSSGLSRAGQPAHWVDVDVGCAEEQSVCAKCHCCVGRIVGRFCLINLLL